MKSRLTIAAIATTTALGGTCAFPVAAASATPAAATTHTLSITSVQEASVAFAGGLIVNVQDKDLNTAGKVVGDDLLHVVVDPKKGTAAVTVVFETSGGFIYGVTAGSSTGVMHGRITGRRDAAGACGYVLKGAQQDEIARAIHAVAAGQAIFGPGIARRVLGLVSAPPTAGRPSPT
jgi:hypothetical protein